MANDVSIDPVKVSPNTKVEGDITKKVTPTIEPKIISSNIVNQPKQEVKKTINSADFAAKITNKVNQTVKEEHKPEVKTVKAENSDSVKPKDYVTDDQFFDDFFADDDD